MRVASELPARALELARRAIAVTRRLRPFWHEPWTILVALALLQWICLAVFAATVRHNGWLFYQGGDETYFYTSAWAVGHGHLPYAVIGYAWSLVISPITWIAGPSLLDALPLIVLLQVVVLLPIALLSIYGIAARIGGRAIGYFAALVWALAPYAAIPLFVERYHGKYVEQFLPQALGLTAMGDFPAMVALLVAAYFVVRAMDEGRAVDAVIASLVTGFAIGIKPSNALFLVAPFVGLVLARRFTALLAFAVTLAPALVTLAVWKYRGLGYLPAFKSEALAPAGGLFTPASIAFGLPLALLGLWRYTNLFNWNHLHNNLLAIREVFWSWRLFEYLPLAGAVAVSRRSFRNGAFLAVWFVTFFVVKGASELASVDSGSFWRLLMPAWPAFVLLMASIPTLIPTYGTTLAERLPAGRSRIEWRSPFLVAPVALLVALPLVVIAAMPKLESRAALRDTEAGLYLPVSGDLALTATLQRDHVVLRWRHRGSAGVRVFYRVYRTPLVTPASRGVPWWIGAKEGVRCEPVNPGAANCLLDLTLIATTRSTRYIDRPPRGRWSYRIGEAANWRDDLTMGDVILLSQAANVSP